MSFLYTENKSGVTTVALLIMVLSVGWVGEITRQVPVLYVYGQSFCKSCVIFKTGNSFSYVCKGGSHSESLRTGVVND